MTPLRKSKMASRRSEKRKKTARLWISAAATALMIAAFIYLWHFSDFLTVNEIRLHGDNNLPIDSLSVVKDRYIGSNIVTIPLDRLRAGLMECRDVAEVVFKRKPPHRVECYLKERKPVAGVLCGKIYEVDEKGIVLSPGISGESVDLPLITGVCDLQSDKGKEDLKKALDVLALLKASGFSPSDQLSEIHMEDGEISLVWLKIGAVIRLGDGYFEERIQKLRNVYEVLERQSSFPRLIDLRFSRQVVIR